MQNLNSVSYCLESAWYLYARTVSFSGIQIGDSFAGCTSLLGVCL